MAAFTNFYRTATAAIGALVLSIAFVSAAVAPAAIGERASAGDYASAAAPIAAPARA